MLKSRQAPPERASRPLLPTLAPVAEGAGGRLKSIPEDFLVEEIPAYPPCGSGEHLYVFIEKTQQTTVDVAQRLAACTGLPPEAVGYAGRKDAWAVTRQWFSLHTSADAPWALLEQQGLRILRTSRHRNKLRLGHLRANAFRIVVRGVNPSYDPAPTAAWLSQHGFPNYFGLQRLGDVLQNAARGRVLFAKNRFSRHGGPAARYQESAYQSALFNDLTAARLLAQDTLQHLMPGDLAQKHENAAVFTVSQADLGQVQQRADSGELSPSAPMIGRTQPWATGWPGALEAGLLRREGLEHWMSSPPQKGPPGERRALRAFPKNIRVGTGREAGEVVLRLSFALDRGVFATSLLREFMRNDRLCWYGDPWPNPAV